MSAAIPALWNKSVSATRTVAALAWATKAIASGPDANQRVVIGPPMGRDRVQPPRSPCHRCWKRIGRSCRARCNARAPPSATGWQRYVRRRSAPLPQMRLRFPSELAGSFLSAIQIAAVRDRNFLQPLSYGLIDGAVWGRCENISILEHSFSAVGAADDQTTSLEKTMSPDNCERIAVKRKASEGAKNLTNTSRDCQAGPAWRHSAHHAAGTGLEVAGLETPVALTWNAAR